MIATQETPVASDTAASHRPSISTVAPSNPSAFSNPPPTSWPKMPPAVSRMSEVVKCSVASPELVATVTRTPVARYSSTPFGASSRSRKTNTPQSNTSTGRRKADCAEHQKRDVGEPRSGRTHSIADRVVVAGHAERRIDGAVAQEREQQNQAESREDPECRFSQTADARHEEGLERRWLWLYSSYTAVNDFNALIILISGRVQSGSRPRLASRSGAPRAACAEPLTIGSHHAI